MQKYPIPPKLQAEIAADPWYLVCARKGLHGHECGGRMTKEHAIIYAGRRLNEKYAIISICAKAHSVDEYQDGGDLDKEINLWIALNRATDEELLAISKAINYKREKARLNALYGVYVPIIPTPSEIMNKKTFQQEFADVQCAFIEKTFNIWLNQLGYKYAPGDFKDYLMEQYQRVGGMK